MILSGRQVENAPEFSGNAFAVLDVPLDNLSFDAQLGADISFTGEHFLSQNLDPLQFQDSYSLINLRAALLDKDEKMGACALLGQKRYR